MRLERLIRFSECIGKLKSTKRSGWVSHAGITEPESVADHSFRCAILAMCIGDLMNADTERLIRMLLLHDVQEALTGDYDSFAKEKMGMSKVKLRERTAVKRVLSTLPADLKKRYVSLWEEFEDRKSFEAVLANDIDKIEMAAQALEYSKQGYDAGKLEAFLTSVQNEVKTPVVRDLFELLRMGEQLDNLHPKQLRKILK